MALDTIAAYIYRADLFCSVCILAALVSDGTASPAALDMDVEHVLDQIAGANAIDRDDEWSFDSDDFPKVAFLDQIDDDRCGRCGCLLP